MLRCNFRFTYLTMVLGIAFSSSSQATDGFINLTCKMNECVWYRVTSRMDIKPSDTGLLVGATFGECTTYTKDGSNRPKPYQCKTLETRQKKYVANCSPSAPSIAFKDDRGKWQRTKLSISEDAEYDYNKISIDVYLRICHDFIRSQESLDMIGAKFGYRSRAKKIKGSERDTVNSIIDLGTEQQLPQAIVPDPSFTSVEREEGFRTPSHNIFCQVLRFDDPSPLLRCDIMNLESSIPPRPRDCREMDWGQAFTIAKRGSSGHRICYTDTVFSETLKTLPYGSVFKSDEFTCKSEPTGVTCINMLGHGFFLSKRAQAVF